VFGAAVSTVQVKDAGDASVFPGAVGRAHVERVGAVAEAGVALRRGARGPRAAVDPHSKLEPPSLEVKEKSAFAEFAGSLG
jgi:hypothetical protein